MARARISDGLRDEIKQYVRDSPEYDTQSEFVKDAVRRLLDSKRNNEVSETQIQAIRKIIKEELDDVS